MASIHNGGSFNHEEELNFDVTLMGLGNILLSEISQIQKEKYEFTYLRYLEQANSQKQNDGHCQGLGGETEG
jgi:hypothetical protein